MNEVRPRGGAGDAHRLEGDVAVVVVRDLVALRGLRRRARAEHGAALLHQLRRSSRSARNLAVIVGSLLEHLAVADAAPLLAVLHAGEREILAIGGDALRIRIAIRRFERREAEPSAALQIDAGAGIESLE